MVRPREPVNEQGDDGGGHSDQKGQEQLGGTNGLKRGVYARNFAPAHPAEAIST
jgi:hypothetical protein